MKKLKQNRTTSFIIIILIYTIATLVGITIYKMLEFSWWISLLIADVSATIITFIFSLIFDNASVYDPYWSVQPPVILVSLAIGKKLNIFSILLIIVILYWGIRLTLNWAYTFKGLEHQDWRYTMLREKTKIFYPIINFIGIHMVPTIIVYGCILPAVYAVINNLNITIYSTMFLFVSLAAITIQGIADYEMHKFQKNKNSIFIRNGLWKYSRHPNYLGEILMWWGIALSVICIVPNAWYLAIGALSNTILFFTVSIPMAEGKQSKKDGFAEYKNQTRILLPIKK